MMRASVVVVGVFFGGEVGGKVYFFEKKCVFGVDKLVEVGYIELAPGPQLACTARASKDVDGRGGAHFFCLNFPQVCKKASKERAFFSLILGTSLWCILLYNSCRLMQKAGLLRRAFSLYRPVLPHPLFFHYHYQIHYYNDKIYSSFRLLHQIEILPCR